MSDQEPDMFEDMQAADWFVSKVRASKSYAQNLYAALCNNDFQKHEVWPMLRNDTWSVSWRSSGGIVAELRNEGDYIDWYCSGMGEGLGNGDLDGTKGYVPEGQVTEEIRENLERLGWLVSTDTKKG